MKPDHACATPVVLDEHALLARCREGDEAAWARLYRDHAPAVRLFLRATIGARADLDDIVQHVFLEFFATLPRFREEASVGTWLHRIAHNVARKECRTWFRWRRKDAAYAAENSPEAASSAEQRVQAREDLRELERALQTLDYRFRVVWVMRELQGLTPDEVAAALGEPAATVRTRHHRARKYLEDALVRPLGIATAAEQPPAATTGTPRRGQEVRR